MKKIPVRKSVAPANGSSAASHGRRRSGLATMAAPGGRSRADEVSGSDSFGVDVEEPLDEPIVAAVDHDDFDDQDEADEVGAAGYPDVPEQFGEDSSDHTTGLDDHIDDPVRMYLMQMGEIPLLSRAEEIASAKEIERTRLRFRNTMLASDYLLQGAVSLLRKGARRQAATRSDDRSLRDQHGRKEEPAAPARAEPENASAICCDRTAKIFTSPSPRASR